MCFESEKESNLDKAENLKITKLPECFYAHGLFSFFQGTIFFVFQDCTTVSWFQQFFPWPIPYIAEFLHF